MATAASLAGLARMGAAAARFLEPDPSAPPIDVRVVIPARDEADNIAACVHACRRQAAEVVVVDDASTDGTAAVAEAAGATHVVRLHGDPPPGWTGKARACHAGAQAAGAQAAGAQAGGAQAGGAQAAGAQAGGAQAGGAQAGGAQAGGAQAGGAQAGGAQAGGAQAAGAQAGGAQAGGAQAGAATEWLAFVDADVVLHPHALATMAAATRHTSTSIVGGLECRSFWERLLLPELGLALVQAGLPPDFASGQCFLVRRDHYEAIGGHGHPSVRASLVDDRDLARALTGHDPRLAPGLLRTRMYRDGRDLRRGLLKNQAALHTRPAVHLGALLLPVATTRPWAAVVVSAGGRAAAGQNPLYGVLAPLARLALATVYLESRWRARTGRPMAWKGRDVEATHG